MDYDILLRYFSLYKHDKIQIFLSKHPNNLFGNNRATFDILLPLWQFILLDIISVWIDYF